MRNNVKVGRGCIVAPKGLPIKEDNTSRDNANAKASAAAASRYRDSLIAKGLIKTA